MVQDVHFILSPSTSNELKLWHTFYNLPHLCTDASLHSMGLWAKRCTGVLTAHTGHRCVRQRLVPQPRLIHSPRWTDDFVWREKQWGRLLQPNCVPRHQETRSHDPHLTLHQKVLPFQECIFVTKTSPFCCWLRSLPACDDTGIKNPFSLWVARPTLSGLWCSFHGPNGSHKVPERVLGCLSVFSSKAERD